MAAVSYFPEPETVAGSVAGQEYGVRLAFARSVLWGHCGFMGAVFLVAGLSDGRPWAIVLGWELALAAALVCLLALTLVRRFFVRGGWETGLSVGFGLLTVISLGVLGRHLVDGGWSVTSLVLAVVWIGLYLLFCGRDFSFVGLGVLGAAFLGVMVPLGQWFGFGTEGGPFLGWAVGTVYLVYVSYDLAMVMRRRTEGEVASSVVDLFRDLLNLATYPVRVFLHWRRYKFL